MEAKMAQMMQAEMAKFYAQLSSTQIASRESIAIPPSPSHPHQPETNVCFFQ
jgi:hypothetical protein